MLTDPSATAAPGMMAAANEKLVLRRMHRSDLGQVHAIEKSAFQVSWSLVSLAREIGSNPAALGWVVARGTRVLGYALCWRFGDEAHLGKIAVNPMCRGRGIGKKLLGGVLDEVRRLGCRYVHLEVRASNTVAQQLYRKYGFSAVGRRKRYYTDNDEDAVLMSLTLSEG